MAKYDKSIPSAYDAVFQQAADEAGVSYDLLRKVAFNESSFNPKAVSKTGPVGIMQFTKATAKAMGLNVTGDDKDDRYNPALAIPAAAKHLASLVNKFNGDELKAALAYNQGEGPAGAPQLEAYDRGDFSAISPEGVGYMRKLTDVARSDRKGLLEEFGGITPKAKGIPAEDAFAGLQAQSKVGDTLPQSTGFSIKGTEQEAPNEPFAKTFWETHGTTLDEYNQRSTFFGIGDATSAELQNSALGVAFRAARVDDSYDVFKDTMTPTKWNSTTWSPEDLERIRNEVKNPSYINVVTGGSPENLDALIKMANDNYEADRKAGDAGLGAKLTAGIIGAGVDPLSYVPMVGVAGKGLKVANKALIVGTQSAGLNVVSEGFRTSIAGGEAHYADAALGGLMFGSGMSVLGDAIAKGLGRTDYKNDFAGPSMRLEARESNFNAGGSDPTLHPVDNLEFTGSRGAVQFAEHPAEEGAVVLPSGLILSETNPVNPKLRNEFEQIDPERASKGISLGGFTEIGLKTLRSEDAEVRGLAADLVRSPTGMEGGSNGKFGATASDVHERLHNTDQRMYNQLYDAMRKAMDDPEFSTGGQKMSREGIRQEIYRRAALAIERPELQSGLTKGERKVMDLMKEHFDTKRELMENPGMFGRMDATSIFPGSRHKGTYVPNVYDRATKQMFIQQYGEEGLQNAIATSWLTSYRSRPEVKARVDEYLSELNGGAEVTPEMVKKHAMDKAYGISHTDQFNASSVIDDNITGLVGIENNSFLEARNLFDSDMPITLPDGQTFSVNDLRDYDMFRIMPAYDRRINGDIAIMAGTGKTTKDLKDAIMALDKKSEGNGKLKGEVEALKDTVKILTGRARRNNDTVFDTALRSLNDLSFFAKNAYMGPQNLTEISGMLAKGNVGAMLNNIPILNDMVKQGGMKGSEIKELHGVLFGREFDQLVRPGRADIIQRLREASDTSAGVANVVGTIKFGTQELAARSPWTKVLNGTANYILDTARQGVLGDVANAALLGKSAKFGKDNFLKSASISKEQWAGIQQLFKDHAKVNEDGSFSIIDKKKFSQDPRAMDLWRLADKVADETMLRPHKVSNQDSKAYGAGVKMAMQFKNFVIKSLNGKFVRSFYEATKNNRAIDQALTHAISLGLAGTYFAMQAHVKALGLQEDQRKDYLKRALNPTMLAYAAVSRSSHLGAPLGIATMVGGALGYQDAQMLRSTILPKGVEEKRKGTNEVKSRDVLANLGGNLAAQVPALGYVASVASTAMNATGVLTAPNKPTERDFMTGLMNATREIVPNDPLTQQLIMKIYEEQGVRIKEPAKQG
ncbi:internal virion protein with endolysin domain [Enterobacter phage phiEap-1]|uniref:Peptidoglycan transglycosylase gp16 n=1 Tax=Enterobacter phage phiEap-1 TaxID=1587520 RepID=A0A0K2FGN0_9CAUD|nr:internal virion protein with endolysin domain [Enterobacter phage phiEap-1]ALA45099.1 internal virion protein D [Enterobacter phage phiEap-1]